MEDRWEVIKESGDERKEMQAAMVTAATIYLSKKTEQSYEIETVRLIS